MKNYFRIVTRFIQKTPYLSSIIGILCLVTLFNSCHAAPLTIAANGKSTFSIVVPKVAAQSVNDAAIEMQRDIAESTGVKLPIVKDDESTKGNFISLGSTKQAQAAAITTQELKDDGFRIVTKGANLYILGRDTTTIDLNREKGRAEGESFNVERHPEIPGPAFTKDGGYSRGTANGVYTFLEDYLNVRWLMPGDIGRDVPRKSTFTIDNIDRTDASMFVYRVMTYFGSDKDARAWRDQMKLGYSFRLNHNHAWADIVPASLYKEHPDWFAMNSSGKRLAPTGRTYKLETTNPELVNFVAEKAIEALRAQPKLNTFSLSPTDSLGYSQSPESKALYDSEHANNLGPSMTPLILKFYKDVSAIVAKEYPQGKLAGYFYQQYIYPPSFGDVKLPENFIPVLVTKGSSFRFNQPDRWKDTFDSLDAWGKIAPPNWFYYDYPTWLRYGQAMVTPAAPDYVNSLFRALVKNHIKGMFYYGHPEWSQQALANYIGAKMLWNPQSDAKAIQHEWLVRAYGPKAGAIMEELYNKMDESWFADYFRQPGTSGTGLPEAFYNQVYGTHYRQMEALILEAEAQPMSKIQKERLELIIDNMRALQWRLRNAGYLPADYLSPYTIDTEQVYQLLTGVLGKVRVSTYMVPQNGAPVTPTKVQIGKPGLEDTADIPNSDQILLYSSKDEVVHLKPTYVRPGSSFLYYLVKNERGSALKRGILDNNAEITFTAKANTPYYFEVQHRGVTRNPQIKWEMSIPGAIPAQANFEGGVVYLNSASKTDKGTVYVYVPEQMDLMTEQNDTGVLIQTQTTEYQASQALRAATKAAQTAQAAALKKYHGDLIQNLDRSWKFSTDPEGVGLREKFAKADFADKPWKPITTIGPWQSQGFPEYNGTAWYRKTFQVSTSDMDVAQLSSRKLLLFVGAVDGDAVFYLNGEKIGERMQADYFNSWQVPFALDVSSSLVVGENTLAVQVTKDKLAGGLYKGVSLMAGVLPKEQDKAQ